MKPKKKSTTSKPRKETKYSRTRRPDELTPVEWQRALRRQFGREQKFTFKNIGGEPFFSEFRVANAESKSTYRVAIRGLQPGDNYCACPDYATNELGTCKHIEFTLGALLKKRGATQAFQAGYRPTFSEVYLRHDNGRTVRFRAGADCPSGVLKAARALFDTVGGWVLPPERFSALEKFLALAAEAGHEVRAYDDALDYMARQRDGERRATLLSDKFPRGAADAALKSLLKAPMYPYQAEGALFAVRAGRALIGDEMGLGKTIQAIAAAELFARHFGVTRVLIVCPTSLKYQWRSEIARFAGRESRVIGGGRAIREKEYALDDFCKITNYEKLKIDLDLITAWAPELVIVDEAQRIKNWNTIASRALKRINSPYAVVLTGTPLENKLEELISIVQFVDQQRLGPTWKLLHEHQVKDEAGRVTGYQALDKIGETLAPVMIRRRKSEVLLQLPARTDQTLLLPMTEPQMKYHTENADIVARIAKRWRKTGYLSDADQRRLTCALQNMRMSCNSTYLLDQESDHGVKADELAALLENMVTQPDAKAVVFSQWTRTHDIVIRRLEERGIGYVSFHGGIPSEKRPALVDRFRDDAKCRVFLSTDAGAAGLNLQNASLLVNMDLPWNPALLEQRIGRIHRMGQKRPVLIVNLVSQGTIEESMLGLLAFKRSLAEGILDGGAGEVSLGGSRLNRFMKDVEKVTGNITNAEVMAPAEESASAGASTAATQSEPEALEADEGEIVASSGVDPWQALADVGASLLAAFTRGGAGNVARPLLETDPASGAQSLRIPLPPPEVAEQLAKGLAALADALRGRAGR